MWHPFRHLHWPGRSAAADKMADILSYYESNYWGADADIELEEIVRYRESDMKFHLAVMINTAFSVGNGFHNTADVTTPTGRQCLEVIDQFCDDWNLDELNQLIAIDVWPSGNAFLAPLGTESKRLMGVTMLPLSSFVRIKRNEYGDVQAYVQEWGGPRKELSPTAVYHFRWLPRDAQAFGTGLGQPLARPGQGYKTQSGKVIRRPPYFAISEMLQDVSVKMTYAGLPRYNVNAKVNDTEKLNAIQQAYNTLDPLQSFVSNFDTSVEAISLDTANKFDSFIRNINDEFTAGIMTPIPRMFSALNFTYASADIATENFLPLIRMYQRAHKRFIENFIYKPLIMQEKNEAAVKKANIQLNWGQQKEIEMEEITQIWNIIKEPQFDGLYDPNDILDMIRQIAPDLKQMEQPAADLSEQMKALSRLKSQHERKIPLNRLKPEEQIKIMKARILQGMVKKK